MTVYANDVAKTKSSALNKAKEMRHYYKPYYKSVTVKVKKLTPLDHKRDNNLKGYTYHIQGKLL